MYKIVNDFREMCQNLQQTGTKRKRKNELYLFPIKVAQYTYTHDWNCPHVSNKKYIFISTNQYFILFPVLKSMNAFVFYFSYF